MRYSASEKFEVIRLVEQSNLSVRQTLLRLGIRKSTFYNWLKRYQSDGIDGLEDQKPYPRLVWNKLLAQRSRLQLSNLLWKSLNCRHGNWL